MIETGEKMTPQILAESLPINRGDIVLIASDLTQVLWNNMQMGMMFDINLFIECIQRKVGKEGTLLFPTYNWGFCHGKDFNYRNTRSLTGALGQVALKRQDFFRTHHPMYSFAVWGNDSKKLYNMNDTNSFFGDTPFEYLYKTKAKMIMLDVSASNSFTFVHYVEEVNKVSYRFLKKFSGYYIDEDKNRTYATYSMFVRYLDEREVVDSSGLGAWLLELGVLKQKMLQNIMIEWLDFSSAYSVIENDIVENESRNLLDLEANRGNLK